MKKMMVLGLVAFVAICIGFLLMGMNLTALYFAYFGHMQTYK
jgi:hypothetical protein